MTRSIYWAVAVLGGLAAMLGLFVLSPGGQIDTDSDVLGAWWMVWALYGAMVGGLVGVVGAVLAQRTLLHTPHEFASHFVNAVRWRGFWTLLTAAGLVSVAATAAAYGTSGLEALSPGDRVGALVLGLNFVAVPGAAIATAALSFAAVSALRNWGGRYALVSEQWFPVKSSRRS